MPELQNQLGQQTKLLRTQERVVEMPYRTNFSFLEEYPYNLLELGTEQLRIDHFAKEISGTEYGWKLICLFNDVALPLDLLSKHSIFIPENFNQAINGLKQKNIRV